MKHIKKFSTGILYEAFINSQNFIRPNVSLIKDNNSIMYNPYIEPSNQISYNFIDLGLPSGTKWANKNLGAENDYDSGLYFNWANTIGTTTEDIGSYNTAYRNSSDEYTKYMEDIDGKYILDLEDDAANVIIGNSAHIPSVNQWKELSDNCTKTLVSNYNNSGINGLLCTSNINNNSIFLPAAGYFRGSGSGVNISDLTSYNEDGFYQSNETYHSWTDDAIYPASFYGGEIYLPDTDSEVWRYWVISIRAVKDSE